MTRPLRLAEFIAALSLATDLGMGQPLEQGLRTCLVALELADAAGAEEVAAETYYTALLRFLGCTADAFESAQLAGNDIALRSAIAPVLGASPGTFLRAVMPALGAGLSAGQKAALRAAFLATGPARLRAGVRAHCEAAEMLASRLDLPLGVRSAMGAAFEQWNGRGFPNGLRGESIPLAARVVAIARDVEVIARMAGAEAVKAALLERAGKSYDPGLAPVALAHLERLLEAARTDTAWETALQREPAPVVEIPLARVEEVLTVFADFADLKEPQRAGFSRAVAALAASAVPERAERLRLAGLAQDLGRVCMPSSHDRRLGSHDPRLGPLVEERLRLHPYYSERILVRVPALEPLARLAGLHHECLDGSGYYRGALASEIPWEARVLAAADAFQENLVGAPGLPVATLQQAADSLARLAPTKLDRDAVDAVLAAAGIRGHSPRAHPAGLSEREVEVLRLLCRGATKKEVALALTISTSTADHHVRHIYEKTGVSSRAAVTLFAVDHELL